MMKSLKFAAAILGLFATTAPAALSQAWEFSMAPGPRWDSPTTSNYFKFRGRAYFHVHLRPLPLRAAAVLE